MPRHPNSDRGREPLVFTSRVCIRCGQLCPFEVFRVKNNRTRSGYSLRRTCITCKRKMDRLVKRDYRRSPEQRERFNSNRRGIPHRGNPDLTSLCQWIAHRCKHWQAAGERDCVVFLVVNPLGVQKVHQGTNPHRWWKGKTWATREDKPGISIPQGGIPLLKIENRMAFTHPTCPERYRDTARLVNKRLDRIFERTTPDE